ncbi:MAG TPA: hypothetical protein VMQ86_11045 [Bryobacteraceae bacterium]|jgi:alpha-galactosidase|nr:hypothetical protein [Bryobacteraceae bacterium]
MQPDHFPARRSFLLGMGVAAAGTGRAATRAAAPPDPLRRPESAMAFAEGSAVAIRLTRSGDKWQADDIEVTTEPRNGGAQVATLVTEPKTRLTRLRLRWHGAFPDGWRFLGDHWERSYGDLEWRGISGDRLMPWYFLASTGAVTHGYRVRTGAASICCWQADTAGITLWLDVSNGGGGVELGGRRLEAATVVFRKGHPGESPLDAARALCHSMCERPALPPQPIYGSNNWYYAYGQDTSAAASLKDAALLAELAPPSSKNRPFAVIDMGWGAAPEGAGPWPRPATPIPTCLPWPAG